jgi:hypothetical protein
MRTVHRCDLCNSLRAVLATSVTACFRREYNSLNRFWPLTLVACGPLNEGRKRRKAIKFAPFRPFPSSKLLVSDSLRGSSSHISEAKNAESGSSGYYLSLGVSLREDATDTRADDWLLSRCASLSNLRYSSPEEKGRGVTLSGVWLLVACAPSSTHDSVNKELASCISGLQTPARMERSACTLNSPNVCSPLVHLSGLGAHLLHTYIIYIFEKVHP